MSYDRWTKSMKAITAFLCAMAGCLFVTTSAASPAPAVSNVQPAPGTVTVLTQITVTFSEPVTNVAAGDFLANGIPAADVTGSGNEYTFILDRQPDYGTVQISWDSSHAITDLDAPPNRFDENGPGATWQYNLIDITPPTIANLSPPDGIGVRSLTQIEVSFSEAVAGVDASDLLINSVPASGLSILGVGKYRFTFPQPAIGTVQVNWTGNHGIHDFAATPNNFAGGSWSYTLDPNLGVPLIRINEFLAANVSGLADENGETEDWIEIWNYGTNLVNLAGYSLTDDLEDPGRWTFPSTNLAAGQFLVVFASGKDRKTITGNTNRFHTNFKLSGNGDYLGLFNAESPRVVISEFTPEYPEQRNNFSYGYDSTNALKYFATPTPGAPNGNSAITSLLPPPNFNVQRGHFDAPFTLILSSPVPGATIRYTTDGSEPTVSSSNTLTYPGPLTISNTLVLRAAAFKTNTVPSLTVTHTYLFLEQVIRQPTNPPGFPSNWGTNLGTSTFPPASTVPGLVPADYAMDMDPVRVDPLNTNSPIDAVKLQRLKDGLREIPSVCIVMKVDDIFGTNGLYQRSAVETGVPGNKPENKKPCSVEMILPDGTTAFATTCGIDLHGNASRNPIKNPKHGFKLSFRSDFGPATLEYRLFDDSPVEEFDDLLLRADFNSSWRHWSDTAGQSLGAFQRTRATRTRDAWMKETMRDMGGLASHNRFFHLYLNGLYWGVFEFSEDPTETFAKNALGGTEQDFDIVDQGVLKGGTITAYNAMLALPTATTVAQYDQYYQYLNVPEFIDYMLLHFFMGHQDWATAPTKNWSAIRKRVSGLEGTFRYVPWDGECILLSEDVNRVTGVTVANYPSGLHGKLMGNTEYRLAFADRVFRHMIVPGGALNSATNAARWKKWQAILDKPIVAESVRWGDYRRDVHQYSEGTYQLYTRENHWLPENTRMMGYFSNRNATVLNQLRSANLYPAVSAPAFNQQGGPVARGFNLTVSATNPIYYTLDGTDPRIYGVGTVSSTAIVYSSAVTLTNSVTVKARALFGTNWSALNEATFIVDALATPLRITEIMYNPIGGDAYEFLELQNVGNTVLNVGLWSIDGIGYVFPPNTFLQPGQIIVLGSDASPANWSIRYPGVTPFARFSGRLDNGGEKLAIRNAAAQVLWSVDYDDTDGWPTAADGGGYSLQIIDVFGDPDDAANWRASGFLSGTPGTIPADPPPGMVALNEVMADNVSAVNNGGFYPDWVEIRNANPQSVSVANWSLSDDSNPRKFVFPPGTTIDAGGYLVVWCDTNSLVPGLRAPFGLGRNGDAVFLYDANTNRVDSIGFGLQLSNLSVGRIGDEWTLTQPTPNAPNVAVTLAPPTNLVINEWLADAPPGGSDWVELYNRSTNAPVSLRGVYLGNGETTHQLSALSFIVPGGFVQLFADELAGADHLDFKLAAEGGTIVLYDQTAQELDRVTYGLQQEGVSEGRLPDGTVTVMTFPASPSPAASNYLLSYSGPILNEVLAINRAAVTNASKRTPDFIELWNTNATPFDLSGMRLSNDPDQPAQWIFPTGTVISAAGYLVIWFDNETPASTMAGSFLNTGQSLDGESGEVWLFNSGGQPVDSVVFGFQVADLPIGRVAGGSWTLLSSVTPGAANSAAATLGSAAGLRLNEWMANSPGQDDWFEIYNSANQPVELSGLLVTDSPAATALQQFAIPLLSFIDAKGFVKCVADGHPSNGRDHVNFSLAGEGEALRLYSTSLGVLDTVYFGLQAADVSQGRLPDGSANVVSFAESATPSESNYQPLPNAVITEVLTHSPPEDAIEIHNPTATILDISGWYLTDSQNNFQKYRIQPGTTVPAGGFQVFSESQLNGGAGSLVPFTLNSSRGGEAWLSASDGAGNLTGYRTGMKFGAAAAGVSFGRYDTTVAVEFPALSQRTLGGTNAYPKVGPVVINEIMYHPPDIGGTNDNLAEEFVEFYNLTTNSVPLFDPAATTNTWRLRGGLSFDFPPGVTVGSRAFLLVVSFNPLTSPATLAAFRAKYGLSTNVPIYGPYTGKLDNGGEKIELFKPDSPEDGFVPYLLVDNVQYGDTDPWPLEADGGGASLQRRRPFEYGNEPANWKAGGPTAGRPNVPGSTYADADHDGMSDEWEAANGLSSATAADANQDADSDGQTNYEEYLSGTNPQSSQSRIYAPSITLQPQDDTAIAGETVTFTVAANGTAPLRYQWRFNGRNLPGAVNPTLVLTDVQGEQGGNYDFVAINEGGFALSRTARLVVHYPPRITVHPQSQIVNTGATVTLTVAATGTGVLHYQWRLDGTNINGATSSTLVLTNVGLPHNGDYTVVVTDDVASVTSNPATVIVRVPPVITQHPASQTVAVGSTVTFTVSATGTKPLGYRWRRGGIGFVFGVDLSSITLTNVQLTNGNTYNVIVTNIAAPGGVSSTNAHLVVVAPPTNQVANFGETITLVAGAGGPPTLRYQWQFKGTNLAGATNITLSLTNVQYGQAGNYTFIVTNFFGTAAGFSATLAVQGPPQLSQPQMLPNGQFQMLLQAAESGNYTIEISTNLIHWAPLTDVSYPGGLLPFTDTMADEAPTRFYRVRSDE